jgi:hypothetical protein
MNLNQNKKKYFLIGFIIVLLIGIPLTIYLIQKQQEVRSRAEKSTNITFTPDSSATAPLQHNVGDLIPLDILVNPGTNLVSYVKIEIQYDPDKLATSGASTFKANTVAFPGVFEGPIYTPGKIALTLSVGPDPTKAIQQLTKAGTLTLKAIANTPAGNPTLVTYGSNTQVLSIGSNDQASENVLSSATPATIAIGGSAIVPTSEETPQPIPTDYLSPTPTGVPGDTATPAPTEMPTETPIPAATATPAPTSANSSTVPPTCSSLTADRAANGNAPFAITLTANGSANNGTINKVTFNFGDGQVSDVTQSGGIGTNSVNVQIAHTYNNTGTYQAQAVITDNNNQMSNSSNCSLTVTVTASGSGGTGSGTSVNPTATPTVTPMVTMAPTGSADIAIGIGIISTILMIGGGLIFFIL